MVETTDVGQFKNQTTGAIYTVIKLIKVRVGRFGGEVSKTGGAPSYKTACGIELNARSTDESVFATLDTPPQILVRVSEQ